MLSGEEFNSLFVQISVVLVNLPQEFTPVCSKCNFYTGFSWVYFVYFTFRCAASLIKQEWKMSLNRKARKITALKTNLVLFCQRRSTADASADNSWTTWCSNGGSPPFPRRSPTLWSTTTAASARRFHLCHLSQDVTALPQLLKINNTRWLMSCYVPSFWTGSEELWCIAGVCPVDVEGRQNISWQMLTKSRWWAKE